MSALGSVGAISVASTARAVYDNKECGTRGLYSGFFSCPKAGGKHLSRREEFTRGLRVEMLRFPCQLRSEAKGSI